MIQFTSHDMAQHRADRLRKALRIAIEVAGITEAQASMFIAGMHDQKGTLWVEWRVAPSDRQTRAMEVAWGLCGESAVRHEAFGKF